MNSLIRKFLFSISLLPIYINSIGQSKPDSVQEPSLPKVWMTYYNGKNLNKDFRNMKAYGVDAVETGIWGIEGNNQSKAILRSARKNDLSLIIGIPEASEEAFKINNPERAVMMGGAFNGKAIDRFRFAFTTQKHIIEIESPVYDSTNCYGSIGRYFMGLSPVRAEVIIKKGDFDGNQHLSIINAKINPLRENYWNMEFDLTGTEGDLNNVVLAVYWTSEGTRKYWIFGDAVSMFSENFKKQLKQNVKDVIKIWKQANGGIFPMEIIALRYGDECFHISGHLNSDACSYPVWDYSQSAVEHFRSQTNQEYPRGVGWTDMFGPEAYARWMYNFHAAAANSVRLVKESLAEEGVGHLPVFRNTSRMNIFDVMNDYDGSGQELLAKELDVLHVDPYPVNAGGYNDKVIPRDMAYMEGLSRRFNKPIVPWMQAHVYGHLKHPEPEHISRMVEQQQQFQVNSIMWLGYGYNNSGNTFPAKNPASWEQAKNEHIVFKNNKPSDHQPQLAVVRPYTAKALRSADKLSADKFLTDYLLESVLFEENFRYDAYEPLFCSDLDAVKLKKYSFILAETHLVEPGNLKPFIQSGKPCMLLINDALFLDKSESETGIVDYQQKAEPIQLKNSEYTFSVDVKLILDHQAVVLLEIDNYPLLWKKNNLFFIAELPENSHDKFTEYLLDIIQAPAF